MDAQVTKTPAEGKSEARCFVCGAALRRACGAIYRYPALCC